MHKGQLDKAVKDKRHKKYHRDLQLEIIVTSTPMATTVKQRELIDAERAPPLPLTPATLHTLAAGATAGTAPAGAGAPGAPPSPLPGSALAAGAAFAAATAASASASTWSALLARQQPPPWSASAPAPARAASC